MRIRVLSVFAVIALIAPGCKNNDAVNVAETPHETICNLNETNATLGYLNSLAIIDSTEFIVSTNTAVCLFDNKGNLVRLIGHSGRAKGEYSYPQYVRTDGNTIFVWSSMTLKFIAYDINGNPLAEYPYDSAISDFIPVNGKFIIYTAGNKGTNAIDVYDMHSRKVIRSVCRVTDEHKILNANYAVSPLTIKDDNVFFMTRDGLDIEKFDMGKSGEPSIAGHINPGSFKIDKLTDTNMLDDRKKSSDYLDKNSYVLLLTASGNNEFIVLTSEGRYERDGRKRLNDNRYYSEYRVKRGKSHRVLSFSAKTFGDPALISVYEDNIYYVSHFIVGDEDKYLLNKLIIKR